MAPNGLLLTLLPQCAVGGLCLRVSAALGACFLEAEENDKELYGSES